MTAADTNNIGATEERPGLGAIEAAMAERIAAAGFRLRRDKVVLRLIAGVRAGIVRDRAASATTLFTITAPIKHPAKTIEALVGLLPTVQAEGLRTTLHGNVVHARRMARMSTDLGVFGFVHNPHADAESILDTAASALADLAPPDATPPS